MFAVFAKESTHDGQWVAFARARASSTSRFFQSSGRPSLVALPATTTVVLSHNPDSKEQLAEFGWDLMLCGHTHGGQLKLPLIGTPFALATNDIAVRASS